MMKDWINWREKMEKSYELKLNEQEMQIIFNALLERPFKEVAEMVAKLQELYRANHADPAQHKQEEIKE